MHISGISLEQLNSITTQINLHTKKHKGRIRDLVLTAEGAGDVRVEYDLVQPPDTRGVPYGFSVKLDGKKAR